MILPLLALVMPLQDLQLGDSLLAAGDTNAAIVAYERLANRNWRHAEAQWRAGLLHMSRHVPGTQLSEHRRRAEERFRYAARSSPDSAKYLLALADLFRGDSWTPTRLQVEGLLDDALAAAEHAHDTAGLVAAEYRLGRHRFEQWERFALRRLTQLGIGFNSGMVWSEAERLFDGFSHPVPGAGADIADAAIRSLRRVVTAQPAHVDAAELLALLMLETHRDPEAVEVARAVRAAAPDEARAWALLGLVYARLDRWREAQDTFEEALARMDAVARAPYADISGVLRAADAERLRQLSPEDYQRTVAAYWALNQPLLITPENEIRTEYYARITYARVRWGDPYLGLDGVRTDRGLIYVRYGSPDHAGLFTGRTDQVTTVWAYRRAQSVFVFQQMPGYTNARLGEESEARYNQSARLNPGRFDNVPAQRDLDTIAAQVVQFRGDGPGTDIAAFTWLPMDRMVGSAHLAETGLTTAVWVLSERTGVQRMVRDDQIAPHSADALSHRSWRFPLAPGDYHLRFEASLPVVRAGARFIAPVQVRDYTTADLNVSDVLVARSVAARDTAVQHRWTDFFIEPSAAHLERQQEATFFWETYNLAADEEGVSRWQVELIVTVTAIERREWNNWFLRLTGPLLGQIGDLVGASALGDEPVSMAWERADQLGAHRTAVDHVTVGFGMAPPGRYDVTLIVTDLLTGVSVERTRTLYRSNFEPGQE